MNRAKILVVDDNAAGRYAISRLLRRQGYEVHEASTGRDALKLVEATGPDLIILDVGLADISGLEVCRQIKANPGTASIAVIHVSATFTKSQDRAEGLEGGADAYLPQPVDQRELLAHVQALLRTRMAENALRRQNRRLELLAEVASQWLSFTDPDQMIRNLFKRVSPELELDAYFSFLVSESGEDIRLASWSCEGVPEDTARSLECLPFGQGVCGTVAQERTPQVVTHLQQSTDPKLQVLRQLGIRAYACHPLLAGDCLLGTLSFAARNRDEFDPEDLLFFRTVSHYAAMARERALHFREMETRVKEKTASLQEIVRELEGFSYSLAHDMRAPLRAMNGFAELLQEGYQDRLDATASDYLRRIRVAAQRLDLMIQDALNYNRLVRQDLPLQTVDLNRLLPELIESYPELQPPRAAVDIRGPLPQVRGNVAALTQCLSGILSNSIKFVEPGTMPRVVIRAETKDSSARIWFEDNGIGIAPEDQGRIFNLFERLPTRREYDGAGIGLAVVRKALERMGGQVGVISAAGEGSRFWIELRRTV